jgi:hypothetical protein
VTAIAPRSSLAAVGLNEEGLPVWAALPLSSRDPAKLA